MRLAQVFGGVVINVIEVSESAIPNWAGSFLPAGDAGPGWLWDGETFAPPAPEPMPVPEQVSRFQAMAALSAAGLLASAEAAVTTAGGLTLLAWDEALYFRRDSAVIAAMAAALELTTEQVDDLFRAAAIIAA